MALRPILIVVLLSILSQVLKAQGKVIVSVLNVENNKGVCRACIFNSEATFAGKGKEMACKEAAISNNTSVIEFENIPQGTYAIALFHDANNNGKMDTNFFGIPKEGYGASKNKLPFAAAPKFSDNMFYVENNSIVRLNVKLRYIL